MHALVTFHSKIHSTLSHPIPSSNTQNMTTLNQNTFEQQQPPTLLIKKNDDVGVVAPLPDHLRQKWDQPPQKTVPNRTNTAIQSKLRGAELRREEFLTWVMEKASRRRKTFQKRKRDDDLDVTSTLDAKLEAAEQIRCEQIEVRQNKARANKIKSEDVHRKRRNQSEQLARRINESLEAAEQRRLAIIENIKEKLSEQHQRISNILYFYQQQQLKNRESLSAKICAKLYQADTLRRNIKAQIAGKGGKKFLKARKTNLVRKMTKTGKMNENLNTLVVDENGAQGACAYRIQLVWHRFKKAKKSTSQLVDDFVSTKVSSLQTDGPPTPPSPESEMPNAAVFGLPHSVPTRPDSFERFVSKIQSPETLKKAQALLHRLNRRTKLFKLPEGNCQNTLKKLFSKVPKGKKLDRYPPRLILCAYMIISHPEVVFNSNGNLEHQLSNAAEDLIQKFENLLKFFYTPLPEFVTKNYSSENITESNPEKTVQNGSFQKDFENEAFQNFKNHLQVFDNAWIQYLDLFAAWKLQDAACLESELIRMAVEMQKSMMKKCGVDGNAPRVRHSLDLQAMVEQVERDHGLLRDRIRRLSGDEGVKNMETAILEAKESYASEMEVSENDSVNLPQNGSKNIQNGQNGSTPQQQQQYQQQNEQGNELWELLYDPNWSYNMDNVLEQWNRIRNSNAQPEYVQTQNIVSQVKQVAERAFWDSVSDMIDQGKVDLPQKISTLISEMIESFLQVIPENSDVYKNVKADFDISNLVNQLSVNSSQNNNTNNLNINVDGLFYVLEKVSCLFTEYGAPVRAEQGIQAAFEVKQKLQNRKQDENVGNLISWALKILHTQLNVLRVDAANAKLRLLAESLGPNGIVQYFQEKIQQKTDDNPPQEIPKLEQFVEQCMNIDLSEMKSVASLQVPTNLSSGRNIHTGLSNDNFYKPEISVLSKINCWQYKFRMGLLELVAGKKPVCPAILPDTMLLDIPRLAVVQNEIQRLVVLSFCVLLVLQHCSQSSEQMVDAVRERINSVLKSGGTIRENLLQELSSFVGETNKSGVEKSIDALLSVDSGAYRSLLKKVQQVFQQLLFHGPQNAGCVEVKAELMNKLKHVGGAGMMQEFVSVASSLGEIIAVQELVYGKFYSDKFLQINN